MTESQTEYGWREKREEAERRAWREKAKDCEALRLRIDPNVFVCAISGDYCKFERCHERKWGK